LNVIFSILAIPEGEGVNEFQADSQNPDFPASFSRSGLGYEHCLLASPWRDWSRMVLTAYNFARPLDLKELPKT